MYSLSTRKKNKIKVLKNLIIRTLTGAVFVSLIIGSALWNPISFAALFLPVAAMSAFEFFRLYREQPEKPQVAAGIILAAAVYLLSTAVALGFLPARLLGLALPAMAVPFILELYRKKGSPFTNIALTVLPVLYIALPLSSLSFLFIKNAEGITTSHLLIGYFILIWTGDTMAYLGGWAFGRHRLFERISPKKSWEGSIIGGLFAMGMGWFLSLWFTELTALQWAGMAAIIIVAGTLGDLAESLLKRSVNVKDSGNFLPGHGGFLDRFDSLFLSAPFVFVYINFIHPLL
jgi:phosphatidate cytidylyltransferase